MPDTTWNKLTWDGSYQWQLAGGEEWSAPWGNSEAQWFGSIFPRIHRLLPVDRILEIAPGFGRWTKYLLPAARVEYFGVDMSGECINQCRSVFKDVKHAIFEKNDGFSLEMIPDGVIDFVFSFDSLVHVEHEVMESYIPQILRKLSPNGVAFIHHSNWLESGATGENIHCRGESVNARVVENLIRTHEGVVHLQETVNWGRTHLIDCFSTFSRKDAYPDRVTEIIRNPRFMDEAGIIRDVLSPYARLLNGIDKPLS